MGRLNLTAVQQEVVDELFLKYAKLGQAAATEYVRLTREIHQAMVTHDTRECLLEQTLQDLARRFDEYFALQMTTDEVERLHREKVG